MMDFISVPTIVGIVFFGVYKIFQLFVSRKERLAIIEQMAINGVDKFPTTINLSTLNEFTTKYNALKIGLLLMGIGLGFAVAFILCLSTFGMDMFKQDYFHRNNDLISIVFGGCVMFFGGLGLIVAFLIETKIKRNEK